MKVYVASSFSLIPRVERVVKVLEDWGYEITVKWWARVYQVEGLGAQATQDLKKIYAGLPPGEFYERPETLKSYLSDLGGIDEADALVLVGPKVASRGALVGANIELGYALGKGKPCFSVGALMNSAMYAGLTQCRTYGELAQRVGGWSD